MHRSRPAEAAEAGEAIRHALEVALRDFSEGSRRGARLASAWISAARLPGRLDREPLLHGRHGAPALSASAPICGGARTDGARTAAVALRLRTGTAGWRGGSEPHGAYNVAYEIFSRSAGRWRERLVGLSPVFSLGAGYALWYKGMGFGAARSGFYLDPVEEPALPRRAGCPKLPKCRTLGNRSQSLSEFRCGLGCAGCLLPV